MTYRFSLTAQSSRIFSFLFLFSIVLIQTSRAQVVESSELYKELAEKDSILFDQGFNECNLTATESLISEDLEFYHDVSGIQDRDDFFKAIRQNICSGAPQKPIRTLVEGSLNVFPLRDGGELYGAIQEGIHEFYIKEPDKKLYQTGSAKFTHVWVLENGNWKLKTVLSYDHKGTE